MNATATTLADLDEDFATALKRKPVATLPCLDIPNGFFTLTFPCGTHRTLRIHTQQLGRMAGKRIVSLLIGPENSTDYEQVGELLPTVAGFTMWGQHRGSRTEEYVRLVVRMLRGEEIDDHELLESKRCLRCNKALTDPESIKTNVGPECRKKERAGK